MSSLKPFIYWFGFEDNIDSQDIHFYQTIILASSEKEALDWGNKLTDKLIENGDAKSIQSSWIEDVIPLIITEHGSISISWEILSRLEIEQYYQGTASSKDKSHNNINVFISTKDEKSAKNLWHSYLLENLPDFKFETCCKPSISITQVGMNVDWL